MECPNCGSHNFIKRQETLICRHCYSVFDAAYPGAIEELRQRDAVMDVSEDLDEDWMWEDDWLDEEIEDDFEEDENDEDD